MSIELICISSEDIESVLINLFSPNTAYPYTKFSFNDQSDNDEGTIDDVL